MMQYNSMKPSHMKVQLPISDSYVHALHRGGELYLKMTLKTITTVFMQLLGISDVVMGSLITSVK